MDIIDLQMFYQLCIWWVLLIITSVLYFKILCFRDLVSKIPGFADMVSSSNKILPLYNLCCWFFKKWNSWITYVTAFLSCQVKIYVSIFQTPSEQAKLRMQMALKAAGML